MKRVLLIVGLLSLPLLAQEVMFDSGFEDHASVIVGTGGGIASSLDGGVSLFVPAGALDQDTEITLAVVDDNSIPGGVTRTSPVYRIDPEGTAFAIPATVSAAIDPSTGSGSTISVVTYDESSQTWMPLDATMIVAGNALAPTDHLSLFSTATQPTGSGCDNIWGGAPGSVAPLHTVGGVTVAPGVKTSEDITFSGPSQMSLGSTWEVPTCSATVEGAFGAGVIGDGAWTDYSHGDSGTITNAGGSFSLVLTNSLPDNPRGPYLGLSDPCHAALGAYHYNLNLHFAADCTNLCAGVNCDDGNPCTTDSCDPVDGSCQHTPTSGACGSTGSAMCVGGLCMVEVPMQGGESGNTLCAAEGLTCSGVPVLSSPEAACVAFNPGATVSSNFNGWRQAVYCNDNSGAACSGRIDDCHHCPACLDTGLNCDTSASDQLERLYASCEP